MDLSAFIRRRISSQPSQQTNQPLAITDLSPLHVRRLGSSPMSLTKFLALLLLALPIFFTLSIILRHPPSDRSFGLADARRLDHSSSVGTSQRNDTSFSEDERTSIPSKDLEETDDVSPRNEKLSSKDKLLGGLLAAGFDEANCISRYQSYLYRKGSVNNPSSYLVNRLRNYEKLHQQCGPDTEPYRKALEQLRSGNAIDSGECKYVVWISFSGLGNRILALASTFLYALLTNRVLLVDRGKDMTDLFCEPFPQNSWFLPSDFPIISQFNSFDQKSSLCHGNMLKNDVLNSSSQSVPSHVYLHLVHDYNDHDKLFFCDDEQSVLAKVPWLIMKTDNYFVPSLFLIPSFEQELSKLFPDKGTVFHHLGRYLFHPSNHVWGLITRYYHTYLGKADETIGIQVRVFDTRPGPFKHVMDQILGCTLKEKLLPDIDAQDRIVSRSGSAKQKAVLVTSLNAGYSENLRNMYWEHPTTNGEFVGVYQPSHEEYQQTEKKMHNRKAWAEMYLLSLTDKLVTSSWSTFGYVAQGLGGLKPWILYKPENETTPDPPCRRAMSMEPCFHAPPFYDCKAKRGTDTGAIVPHVRHCEDMSWGLKVVDGHDEL